MFTPLTQRYLSPALLALLLLFFTTSSLSTARADSAPWDKRTLHSASELDYPPFAIVHPDGTAGGFSVDLLKAAVHAAGLTVTFNVGPWNQIKEELARGELDVLPLVSYSAERDKIYDFTAPYLQMNGTVFVRKGDHEIKTISDLKGKEVLVMQGDTAHEYLMRTEPTDRIITTPSLEEAFRLLAAGNHDAVVAQQIVGFEIIKKLGLTTIVAVEQKHISSLKPVTMKLEGFEQKFCFAVTEGNHHLLSLLNEGLAVIYVNGTYNSLYEKWFTPLLPHPEIPLSELFKRSLQLLIPFLFLLALGGMWYLRRQVAQRTHHLQEEIQRRALIERELADANAKYIKAEQLGKVGNWEYDIATQEFHGSSEALRIFGFTSDDSAPLSPEKVESCIPERERVHQATVDLIEKNVPYNLEYNIIAEDSGTRKTVISRGELQRDESGTPVTIQGVILDITEQRQTETSLRESEERFRRAVASSPIPMMIHDEDDRVLQLSIGWTNLSGYSLEDIPSLPDWTEKAYGERNGVQKAYIDDLFNIDRSVSNGEWTIKTKDGSTRIWDFQSTPLGKNSRGSRILLSMAADITERKTVEESLRETVEMLRALVEGMPDIVMRFDRDGRHLFVSENVVDLVDIEAKQFIGKTHRQLGFPEEMCIFWENAIRKSFDEGTPLELEYSFEGRDGQVVNNWRLIPEHDAHGQVESLLSINRDISAQKKAEKDYQLLFREMLEGFALHEIICDEEDTPVDYRFLTVNPSFEKMTGLDADKIIGKKVLEVLPDTENYWIETYGRVAMSGEPVHFENYSSELDKYFETTAFRPAPNQFACIVNDITKRKRTEEEIRRKDKQLADISSRLPGLVFQFIAGFDGTRTVSYITGQVEKMLGLDPDPDGFFERFTAAIHPDHREDFLAEIEETITLKNEWNYEGALLKPSGELVWISGLASPTETTNALLYDGVIVDISERKVAEEEKNKLQTQLQQAQKMEAIGTLAGGIAHDFNNILGAMIGYAEMVREDSPENSQTARDLDKVLTAGNRAKSLVKQILAFSRQNEASMMALKPTTLVKEVIKLLRSSIPSTITIEQNLARDCNLVFADPNQIHQIVMNLCTNAFHAMETRGGILSITVKNKTVTREDLDGEPDIKPGNFVEFSIRDSGTGIPPEILDKIFDPYFTTKEVGKGTGMGLAITHGIVKSYDGFIRCESQVNKGTIFRINLPAWEEQEQKQPAEKDESILLGDERILFVDDEEMLAEMAKVMLERLGYSVTVRTSSLEALNTFKNEPHAFDLVITDQTMPGITGFDLSRRMLQIRADISIILCTGYSSVISEEQVLSAGIKGFALKPLVKKEIAALIRTVLDERTVVFPE